ETRVPQVLDVGGEHLDDVHVSGLPGDRGRLRVLDDAELDRVEARYRAVVVLVGHHAHERLRFDLLELERAAGDGCVPPRLPGAPALDVVLLDGAQRRVCETREDVRGGLGQLDDDRLRVGRGDRI